MTSRSRRLQNMDPDEHLDRPTPPPFTREAVATSPAPMLAAGTVVPFPTPEVLWVLPLHGSPAPVGYIYDATPDAEGGLLAAASAFFPHQGHQVFHDPCPDLDAYRRTWGVILSIIPVDCLPGHILSSGLKLLEGLLAPSPTDSGTAFLTAYLASPPLTTSGSNLPYIPRPAPSAMISSLGGTACVPGGSALRAPAPHDTAFTGP